MKIISHQSSNLMKKLWFPLTLLLFMSSIVLHAAWFNRLPYTVTQPDGSTIECFVSGDEFFNWLHDDAGFTIIVGDDGFYYYGTVAGEIVVPTTYRINSVNPESVGLQPWAKISQREYQKKKDEFWKDANRSTRAPHSGILNNLVVYIRFNDQPEFSIPRTVYDGRFNNPDGSSLQTYYTEVSYDNLLIDSHHYPICDLSINLSYQDSHNRSYFEPYHAVNNPDGYKNSSQRTNREHTLLKDAIAFIHDEVPLDLDLDADNDGLVDNMCFIIRGNSGAWADLLWAHRWVLYTYNVYIHGKKVYDYTFQPENQNDVQTLCHEMFHSLGAPDLYHYTGNGISPAGPWDLMESGYGHMLGYMKYKYAGQTWITEIPEITTAGTYTLNPLTSPTNNIYKIASPNSPTQFFVVEYRRKVPGTYEMNLPGSGLLVYRIDLTVGDGNADGPPDEVYVYRPNGTTINNGTVNQAYFASNVNRTAINDYTNPSSFLQNGSPGGLNIFNIGQAGETISFDVLMGTEITPDIIADVTTVPAGGSVHFTDNSSNNPTSWLWSFPGGNPATSTQQNPTVTYETIGIYDVGLEVSNSFGSSQINLENYIIVGDPEIQVTPEVISITLAPNQNGIVDLTINNTGNTWLRYSSEKEFISPAGEVGAILGTYGNVSFSRSGITWADGSLYIVGLNGTLNVYDTVQKQIVNTYDIHAQPFSIAYDGEYLWIGKNNGTVMAYTLEGVATGASFQLPTSDIYSLAWDGNYFIANLIGASNPTFYRVDNQGEILQVLTTGFEDRVTQLVWVPSHAEGNLWASSLGKILHFTETDDSKFELIEQFDAPASLSYSIAHDGTDLWWSGVGNQLYRFEDGVQDWFYFINDNSLIEANSSAEFPVYFKTKSLEIGVHSGMIKLYCNDPSNPVVEIPVNLIVKYDIVLPGDSNCDGVVNINDLVHTVNYILGMSPIPFCFDNADFNGDGTVDTTDLVLTINLIMGL